MRVSRATRELREKLDAAGIGWADASEERRDAARGCVYHMERTRAADADGIEVASCVWGYTVVDGVACGATHGWPTMVECARLPLGGCDPEPMGADDIVAMVDAERRLAAPLRRPRR